jgi:hypothetical protein
VGCCRLTDLPPPLTACRTGWPWTEETPPLGPTMPDGAPWPRITVVTPSFNQSAFLEEAIRSVLLQGYPDLEYFVIDGGSVDTSVGVIEAYAPWLSRWVSERDRGQSDAVAKGLRRATGTVFNWVNSDDLLLPGALASVARGLAAGHDAYAGGALFFGEGFESWVLHNRGLGWRALLRGDPRMVFVQPALWLRTQRLVSCGGINPDLNFYFDMEMTIRYLALAGSVRYDDARLAAFRLHPSSKTVAQSLQFAREYRLALSGLAAWDAGSRVAGAARRRLKELDLHETVARLLADPSTPRRRRAMRLVAACARDPHPSVLRIAAAAMRRLVRDLPWLDWSERQIPVWAEPYRRSGASPPIPGKVPRVSDE